MLTAARVLIDGANHLEFHYGIPAALADRISPGSRVRIPLRARAATGTVIALDELAPDSREATHLRDISALIDENPVLTPQLLELGKWIADYYCAPMESVMRSLLPEAVRTDQHSAHTQKFVEMVKAPTDEELEVLGKRAKRQASILRDLLEAGQPVALAELQGASGSKSVESLAAKGWVKIENRQIERDPYKNEEFVSNSALKFTDEQAAAFAPVDAAIEDPASAKPILLYGVTGSGKTEVYLQAIQRVLDRGQNALVLVPEISLTPQTVNRFKSRFADIQQQIAVLHSHLSQGERYDEWHKIHRREARIVIGARSAIFAPLEKLGLIVVDEEHESSYKQENPPRYHARDIAVVRSVIEKCPVVLGSATPSLESWQNTITGKYALVKLTERIDNRTMPLIRIIDMRREAKTGKAPTILSRRLRAAVEARLEKGEQVILFLNRRGFATSMVCPACGHVVECRHCSVALTFHRKVERLMCHICGFQQISPRKCPKCGDSAILFSGYGTEKVEDILRKVFPKARLARVDADTMARKNALRNTLREFKTHKLDMLVGTQMIAKGLHFPNVTLVGILNADISLHMPDFRAGERTFQLLTQVAGRAGRGEMEGEVIVQTFTPHSPSIQFARHHDFAGYSDQELHFRKQFNYPPYSHVVVVTAKSTHERRAEFCLENLHKRLGAALPDGLVLGDPGPASLAKAAGQFRFQLMIRAASARRIARHLTATMQSMTFPDDVHIGIDVDALQMG